MTQNRIDLTRLHRFENCSEDDFATIKRMAGIKEYKRGSELFHQDQDINGLYVIASGYVKVMRLMNERQILLNIFDSGDAVGEMALIKGKTFPATATAITTVSAVFLPVYHYNFLKTTSKTFANSIANSVACNGMLLLKNQSALVDGEVEQRLIGFFSNLFRKHKQVLTENKILLPYYISRSDIASAVGARSETISRVMSRWEQADILTTMENCMIGDMLFFEENQN